jgi:hypothetical protein
LPLLERKEKPIFVILFILVLAVTRHKGLGGLRPRLGILSFPMQENSALIIGPIEDYLSSIASGLCLVLPERRIILPEQLFPGERAIFPNYLIGEQITSRSDAAQATARITILHSQQNSLRASLGLAITHRITILSQAQTTGDCCNNRDYCVAAIDLGLNSSESIDETGGLLFSGYRYTGVMWLESSISPTWDSQFGLFKARTVLAIQLGDL